MKYSPTCKTVWVDGRVDGTPSTAAPSGTGGHGRDAGWLVLSVRDRGVGVAPTERRTIFGKFVRGSAAEASSSTGTGLGLAMVEHIVEAHGGRATSRGSPARQHLQPIGRGQRAKVSRWCIRVPPEADGPGPIGYYSALRTPEDCPDRAGLIAWRNSTPSSRPSGRSRPRVRLRSRVWTRRSMPSQVCQRISSSL